MHLKDSVQFSSHDLGTQPRCPRHALRQHLLQQLKTRPALRAPPVRRPRAACATTSSSVRIHPSAMCCADSARTRLGLSHVLYPAILSGSLTVTRYTVKRRPRSTPTQPVVSPMRGSFASHAHLHSSAMCCADSARGWDSLTSSTRPFYRARSQ